MTVVEIKTELKGLIEQENDPGVLKAIRTLLKKAGLNQTLKEKLTSRALRSNEDIKAGRALTRKEIEKGTEELTPPSS